MPLADRDPALFDRLEIAACAAAGDPATLGKRLAAALKRALRTGRFVDYADAGDWARGVLDVLDQLEPMIAAGQGSLVLDLLDDFMPRVDLALNDIDDSNGEGGEILSRAADLHLAACRAAPPDPFVLARELFRRETTDPYGTFGGASETYADLLGSKGQAAYRALAEAAWAKLPRPNRRERRLGILQTDDINRGTLFRILDHLLTQYGDVDRRIALRTEDLRGAYDYLNLAQLCLDHGRLGAALRWAEEGAWLHDDPASERLLVFLAARYRDAGRRDDAEAALWRGFDRRPSAELFAALCALRPAKKARTALTDQAAKLLEARVEKQKRDHRVAGGSLADLLVHILIGADRLPSAWTAADRHGCSDQALEALARASESTMSADALDAYIALAERQIGIANKHGYQAACRLITRIGDLRTRLGQTDKQQAGKHRAYVDDLLRRHAAKRSFVALLHTVIAKPKTTVIYDSRAR